MLIPFHPSDSLFPFCLLFFSVLSSMLLSVFSAVSLSFEPMQTRFLGSGLILLCPFPQLSLISLPSVASLAAPSSRVLPKSILSSLRLLLNQLLEFIAIMFDDNFQLLVQYFAGEFFVFFNWSFVLVPFLLFLLQYICVDPVLILFSKFITNF